MQGSMHRMKELQVIRYICHADQELRLVVCGYIRPEQNFQGLNALIERIHEDGRVSEQALDMEPFQVIKNDSFLRPS